VELLRPLLFPEEQLCQPIKLAAIISLLTTGAASFSLDALLALRVAAATAIDATIAEREEAVTQIDAVIASRVTASFGIDALLVPQPGFAIFNAGSGTWTCPPGVAEVNAYLFGLGGNGSPFIIFDGGPGGGGAGFAAAFNAPVTPGLVYSWVVEPELTALFSSFNWDGGGFMHVFRGQPGNMAGPGAGGFAVGGDLQFIGGNGGEGGDPIGSPWGGGGGQAAGPWGNGMNGGDASSTAAGLGGGVWTEMGSGGPGGSPFGTTHGLPGMLPGGGGGGQAQDGFAAANFALGASGLLILTWNAGVFFLDGTIAKVEISQFSLDAALAVRISSAASVDALIADRKTATYTTDAYLLEELLADDGISPLWADDGATWLTPG
jgi:hypothetical protein